MILLGGLFNHDADPNMIYSPDFNAHIITYTAARNIAVGEELTIYYGENLWFHDSAKKPVESSESDLDTEEDDDEENTGLKDLFS